MTVSRRKLLGFIGASGVLAAGGYAIATAKATSSFAHTKNAKYIKLLREKFSNLSIYRKLKAPSKTVTSEQARQDIQQGEFTFVDGWMFANSEISSIKPQPKDVP